MAVRTIRRDGKAWRYEVTCYGSDGRQRRRRFATKGDAETFEAQQRIDRLASSGGLRAADLTVGQLVGHWWRDYEQTVRLATQRAQWARWQALEPLIGDLRLDRLRSGHLDDAFAKLARQYAVRTVAQSRQVLGQAIGWAIDRGILDRNPIRTMRPIGGQERERDSVVWTLDEVRRVMTWADGVLRDREATRFTGQPSLTVYSRETRHPVMVPLVLVMLWTGLRSGEARALRWSDIERDVIQVRRTFTAGADLGPPKTRSSRRGVTILEPAAAVLAFQRERQADRRQQREAYGLPWVEEGWVFDNGLGRRVITDTLAACVAYVSREAEVRLVTPHGLRHTFATMALEAGVPGRVVQEMLGHANLSMTMDLYSHVSTDLQRVAGELLMGAYRGQSDIAVPTLPPSLAFGASGRGD